MKNRKFQMVFIHDTTERLPFISLAEITNLDKNTIYIRRGTKCEKANSTKIGKILETKISKIFKETSDMLLEEHLSQLKLLYSQLPQKNTGFSKK